VKKEYKFLIILFDPRAPLYVKIGLLRLQSLAYGRR